MNTNQNPVWSFGPEPTTGIAGCGKANVPADLSHPARLLIVEGHPFFRLGVRRWIEERPGLKCVGEAACIAKAREAVCARAPQIVLTGLSFADGDGLAWIQWIGDHAPSIRTIVLSDNEETVFGHRSLRAGARGYVMKLESPEILATAIARVLAGGVFVSRRLAACMLENLFPDPVTHSPPIACLSDREITVFQLLGIGHSSREIADLLHLSIKTVQTYRENIKHKLSLPHGQALILAAVNWVRDGCMPAPEPSE